MAIVRGCGTREPGGVYLEVITSLFGIDFDFFLTDPPIPIDVKALGISPKGVRLLQDQHGTTHVWDWVGSENYPNVADFVEEARRYGVSRRLSDKIDFSKLNSKSKIILLHRRAFIDNFRDYSCVLACPLGKSGHNNSDCMCVKLWWDDIDGADAGYGDNRHVIRRMPSFDYRGLCRPVGVYPVYLTAIFASFPISRLVVIRDPAGQSHEAAAGSARHSSIPVEIVDE